MKFLLRPHDDELCYSVLARTVNEGGILDTRHAMRFLYVNTRAWNSVRFPATLNFILHGTGLPEKYADIIINRHTLTPYYSLMWDDKKKSQADKNMLSGRFEDNRLPGTEEKPVTFFLV